MLEVLSVPLGMPALPPCTKCEDSCFGHYQEYPSEVATTGGSPVSSVFIREEFDKNDVLSEEKCENIAKSAFLNPEFVQYQWDHLKQTKKRRKGQEPPRKICKIFLFQR